LPPHCTQHIASATLVEREATTPREGEGGRATKLPEERHYRIWPRRSLGGGGNSSAPVYCIATWGRERVLAAPLLERKRGSRESGGRERLVGTIGERGTARMHMGDGGDQAAREGESEGTGYIGNLTSIYILVTCIGRWARQYFRRQAL